MIPPGAESLLRILDMKEIAARCVAAAACLAMIAGCYYMDERYRYGEEGDTGVEGSVWDDEESVVQPADRGAGSEAPEPEPAEEPDDMVDVRASDKPEDVPGAPGDKTEAPGGVPSESIGKYNVHFQIAGISPEMKQLVETKVKALSCVEYVETLYYGNGEMKLGVRLKGTLECFVDEVQKIEGLEMDFLGSTTLILSRMRPRSGLAVEILLPRNGANLSTSKVWVGVEVKKGRPESVVVNGVTAVPMKGQNRFKALIQCRNGSNEIVAVVKSGTGEVAESRITVNVASDEEPAEPTGRSVLVQGKIDDPNGSVTIDGKEVKVDDTGHYQVKVQVANGAKFITVVETDSLGNKTVRKISVE